MKGATLHSYSNYSNRQTFNSKVLSPEIDHNRRVIAVFRQQMNLMFAAGAF